MAALRWLLVSLVILPASAYAQGRGGGAPGVGKGQFGIGGTGGYNLQLGVGKGFETFYHRKWWQLGFAYMAQSISLKTSFANEIYDPASAGGTRISKEMLTKFDVSNTQMRGTLRIFPFGNTMNLSVGYGSQKTVSSFAISAVDVFENTGTTRRNALFTAFGNRWQWQFGYVGIDWFSAALSGTGATSYSSSPAPSNASAVIVNQKVKEKIVQLGTKLNWGIEASAGFAL